MPEGGASSDGLKQRLDDFTSLMDDVDFQRIFKSLLSLDDILDLFDGLKKPLDVAGALVAPIEPLLNAVGALVSTVVDPVVDYLLDTLGIKELIEEAEQFIDGLLPPLDLLDALKARLQAVLDTVLDYVANALGTTEFLDLIETTFFGNVVGDADAGPTGWGDALDNTLNGDSGDDILDGLGGNDAINGGGGNDIILAGAGSDTLDGGAGDDMFYFDASFSEYEVSRAPDTNNIFISHLRPGSSSNNTGVDLLLDLDDDDSVVFTDISFTGAELKNAIIGGSVLNGTGDDDLMFLNASGTTVDGFHVANGNGGDDRIFGSTEDDQLNGNKGNDILIPGDGDDQANGGSGTDTFQVLEGANDALAIDLQASTAFGQGRDTFVSIENVIIAPNRDHHVAGSDAANAIYTGNQDDIITGRGGHDTIDGGGGFDSIIGGDGADVIYGGAGNDYLVSGSAAVAGIVDTYYGGASDDRVSYSSSAGSSITFTQYMSEVDNSGPVKIIGEDRTIERYDTNGNLITTDVTFDVESFMGLDMGDTITGAIGVSSLKGAGGNDTIRSNGALSINGDSGDDLLFAQRVEGGANFLSASGGSGFDRLDVDQVGEVRWFYIQELGGSARMIGYDISVEGGDLRNAGNRGNQVSFTVNPGGFEEITFGDFDDEVFYQPGGPSSRQTFFLRDGEDLFDGWEVFADVHAGQGNDIGYFDTGGNGIFRGQRGNDFVVFDGLNDDNQALMGFDDDTVRIVRFFGYAEGNDGYDFISFDLCYKSRLEIDLQAGTAVSFKDPDVPANDADQVDMTLSGFEEIIAGDFNDLINGSVMGEQILGRAGDDTITSHGGSDRLFGGAGDDSLSGGGDTDQIHGGLGNDYIDGGTGRDTASFSWVRPDGLEGALTAGQFGGSNVNLNTGIASGQFGTDTLVSIENVIGSDGDDILQGNGGDNLLSGAGGDDALSGNNGDDVLVTGSGNDTVSGGNGDDVVVVGLGNKTLFGGAGTDTLDFGTVKGVVTIDFEAGSYDGTFVDMTPRWLRRDLDEDGIEESTGYEVRFFGGIGMTPQQVLEANPLFANSDDDNTRALPQEDDAEFDQSLIEKIETDTSSLGTFSGFEQVIGGESGANIILTNGVDRFDGRISDRDVVDFSNVAANVVYNFQTGATNVGLLTGDELTDIEGARGGTMDDAITGDGRANFLFGNDGKDVLKGSSGDDALDGDAGG